MKAAVQGFKGWSELFRMPDRNQTFKAEHNKPFNADAVTIMHNEGSLVLDFKNTTPRFDQVNGDAQHTVITEHNAVTLNPQMAKILLNLLQENIEDYEEKFGEIELPDQEEEQVDDEMSTMGYIG